jgi:hypothetical protein
METKLEQLLRAAIRLLINKYRPWQVSGGPNECKHGISRPIACRVCDEELLAPYVHYGEELPGPSELVDKPKKASEKSLDNTTYGSLFGGSRKP